MERVALQLYSIKEAAGKDLLTTMDRVARMGFGAVEFAGFFGHSPDRIRQRLRDTGLEATGSHVPLPQLLSDSLESTLAFHEQIGCRLLVCPYLEERERHDADGWRRVADKLNRAGERCRQEGFTLAYHNHDFEFETHSGKSGLEWLLEETDPANLGLELDTYWIRVAGESTESLLDRYPGRTVALHLKDRKQEGETFRSTPLGEGDMDFPALIRLAKENGITRLVVEQEHFDGDPMDSAALNVRRIHSWLSAHKE